MVRTPQLAESVEALYASFNRYPLHADTHACPCCHRPEQEWLLHSKPLRQLDASQLQLFAFDAILVWGDITDFKHFLPRIFELMSTLDAPTLDMSDPAIIYGKLGYGDWLNWPQTEVTAVRHYLMSLWQAVLQSDPAHCDAEDWLCGISQAEEDLSSYLAAWSDGDSTHAARHLAILLTEHAFVQVDARPRNFWAQRKEQFDQVRRWLLSDAAKGKLRALTGAAQDDNVRLAMRVLDVD
jgi:hypothetical protein